MILRVFRVRGPEGHDAAVLRFVDTVLARSGDEDHRPITVEVARRLVGRAVEVVVVSKWRTWEDIQAWTGPDVTRPLDTDLPEMFDVRIEHFESVDPSRPDAAVERPAMNGIPIVDAPESRPSEA
jgi:hypothetical protein